MNKNLLSCVALFLFCFSALLQSQTYQLIGNPVVTTGWDIVPSATVSGDFIQLTANQTGQVGGIKLNAPINLKYCDKWRVEFDFRIDGTGTPAYGNGDGLAFWYLNNPPASYTSGGGLGIPANSNGLMVGFDIFNNSTEAQMSKIHVLYGTNNTAGSNIEFNNTAGSTYHTADLNPTQPFVGATYKHVEVLGEVSPTNPNNWVIQIKLDNVTVVNQTFAPSGGAIGMTTGYFGFSASTGAASARHSIKNVKVYTDKVPILQNTVSQSNCPNPTTGFATINLTSFNTQFVANPSNYTFTYYVQGNPTPIANPTSFQYNANTTINVFVKDNAALLCDNPDGKIQLTLGDFTASNVTLTTCNNNYATTATFNLTTAAVTGTPGAVKKYYKTLADLTNNVNEITNPAAYVSAPGKVYVKVTTPQGCTGNAEITLSFFPLPVATDASIQTCFGDTLGINGIFDLTTANVSSEPGITKVFYTSLDNAINNTNPIANPTLYPSSSGTVYVKVTGTNSCYVIRKITLTVIPPTRSSVLKDKIICIEDRTNLDAGPGFVSYEWSTGATTQSISGISVGSYWVRLQTGNCYTIQLVNVKAAGNPVISSLDIKNNTITVNVSGGTPAYQYSLDGTNWQNSNVFTGLPRGENTIFVKDSYDCEPIAVQVTVPNLINAITPNGDNINDVIDYTELAYKKNLVFTVYDRYGNKKFEADKIRNFKWDGTSGNKKLPTGTYWYTISWNENDKNNTQTIYNGWVLLKNRE
ncbi:T9SS type B sorting domain-containing protein [Chryseobacterium sp.]|uniref:T9SS type B sorting domain-containing protein n=1 Tax=Chryseobacterium sp. TaxID=1871047 RepID=UPI0028A0B4EF|nr:T9SS type B sorting domain-containing protein [Chryseobacterium sp.]